MKNKVIYGVREEIYSVNGRARCGYGIVAYAPMEDDTGLAVIASVSDVTSDREALEDLVLLCNEIGLDPCHLYNVVEDFLCR